MFHAFGVWVGFKVTGEPKSTNIWGWVFIMTWDGEFRQFWSLEIGKEAP